METEDEDEVGLLQNLGRVDGEEGVEPSEPKPNIHFVPDPHAKLPVYITIQRIHRLITEVVDNTYTAEELRMPRSSSVLLKDLASRLYDPKDISLVYCLLINRKQFLYQSSRVSLTQTLNVTRAILCELVAIQILRRVDEEHPGRAGLLLLSNILVAGFEPFQNAPQEVMRRRINGCQWPVQKRGGYERKVPALEVAVISDSKTFLSCYACRKVVDAVYHGHVVYTPLSFVDILPDHYIHKPISLYNPHQAPLLNEERMVVPRLRGVIEVSQFIILLGLYVLTMVFNNGLKITIYEIAFCTYTSGWILEEFAALIEHGWKVHTQNLWSFLDLAFIMIYFAYFFTRISALANSQLWSGKYALNILSIAAPVLVPRLAFSVLPDNMLFISLRAMMRDFTILTLLAIWCFAGFYFSMRWLLDLSDPAQGPQQGEAAQITIWMLWIWFGLDGTGIERSVDFHVLFGPALMVTFAFLGNTLFLTILVAMLTNTFSKIVAETTAEIQYRRAVLTIEGVKSDSIFAYRPPFNILALLVLLPLKCVLSAKRFHEVNSGAARVLNAPILLFIGLYERRRGWEEKEGQPSLAPKVFRGWNFTVLFPHSDIHAVFDAEPPDYVLDEFDDPRWLKNYVLEGDET